jgi:hypothetical protein
MKQVVVNNSRSWDGMDLADLIPRTKSDYERLNKLKMVEQEHLLTILPQLLEWLQDMNWPIAQDIENILVDFGDQLIPHIQAVLNSVDGGWKHSLLYGLINRLSVQQLLGLKSDLERMKYQPTRDEEDEDFAEMIDELLKKLNC